MSDAIADGGPEPRPPDSDSDSAGVTFVEAPTAPSVEGSFGWIQNLEPHLRVYHSRLRLLDGGWQFQGGFPGMKYLMRGDGEQEEICPVLELVLSVRGVERAEVRAWKLIVWKSPIFHWHEIDAHLLPLMMGIPQAFEATHASSAFGYCE